MKAPSKAAFCLCLWALCIWISPSHQMATASRILINEKEHFKQDIIKQLTEYLNSVLAEAGPEREMQDGYDRNERLAPLPSADTGVMSKVLPKSAEEYYNAVNMRSLAKKSNPDNKHIRFHQCYFNPISCF